MRQGTDHRVRHTGLLYLALLWLHLTFYTQVCGARAQEVEDPLAGAVLGSTPEQQQPQQQREAGGLEQGQEAGGGNVELVDLSVFQTSKRLAAREVLAREQQPEQGAGAGQQREAGAGGPEDPLTARRQVEAKLQQLNEQAQARHEQRQQQQQQQEQQQQGPGVQVEEDGVDARAAAVFQTQRAQQRDAGSTGGANRVVAGGGGQGAHRPRFHSAPQRQLQDLPRWRQPQQQAQQERQQPRLSQLQQQQIAPGDVYQEGEEEPQRRPLPRLLQHAVDQGLVPDVPLPSRGAASERSLHAAWQEAQQQQQRAARQLQQGQGQAQVLRGAEQAAAAARPAVQRIPVADVAVMTVMMAASAGLGALPFFFVKSLSTLMTGLATAVACGVMFACSFDLVHSGQPYGAPLVVLGIVLGGLFIRASQQWLETMEDVQFENLRGAGARKTVLLVGVMAAHALGEGCGVGVSFVGDRGWTQGVLTTLAIGVHNVPEGLAKATVLVSQGVSARNALLWSVLTCLPQPLVAIPSFLFVEAFRAILPTALGFAGGCMIWIVFAELLPDAFSAAPAKQVASAATLAAAGLEGVRMMFESLEEEGHMGVPNPFPGDFSLLLPALGVMLPAVGAAALAGGLLSNTGLPSPVNYGMSAALLAAMGALPLLRALLPLLGRLLGAGSASAGANAAAPGAGLLQLVVGAASGALLVILLHNQLLQRLQRRRGYGRNGGGGGAKSFVDLEAAGKKDSDASLSSRAGAGAASSAQLFASAYPLLHALPAAGGPPLLGGAGSSGPAGPDRGGSHSPRSVGAEFLGAWGLVSKAGERRNGFKLGAAHHAASATAALVLLAYAIPQGWHLARSMAIIAPEVSMLLLPAALSLGLLGSAAGALLAATAAPSPARGAVGGALLGCVSTLCALFALARFDPGSGHLARMDPHDLTGRLQAVLGGGLCLAAHALWVAGEGLHARRARGGLLLGALLAMAVAGFAGVLCAVTPYCLDPPIAS